MKKGEKTGRRSGKIVVGEGLEEMQKNEQRKEEEVKEGKYACK